MHPTELLDQLRDLARAAGIEVRQIPGAGAGSGEGEPATGSGICRVKGRIWVLLAARDSLDEHIDVLALALRDHAREFLEARYLPPAVRERLGVEMGGDFSA
jgi:hypothetical protein